MNGYLVHTRYGLRRGLYGRRYNRARDAAEAVTNNPANEAKTMHIAGVLEAMEPGQEWSFYQHVVTCVA